MRGMFSKIGRYSVALITFFVMFSLLSIYLFIYIPSQREYFTKRNLRILNVMSTQIKSKIENFGGVIHNIVDDIEGDDPEATVHQRIALVPDLTLKGARTKEIKEAEDAKHEEHHQIDLHAELEGNHYTLHFEYTGHFGEKKLITIHASSQLDDILAPIIQRGEFDDFLVVQMKADTHDGKNPKIGEEEAVVIYQKSSSELRIAQFDSLEDTRGRKFLFSSQINHSNIKDIKLLGTDYKLFLQPFFITLHQDEIESEQTEEWVLVGLLETNRFNSECRSISKHLVFLFFLLVVIAILSLPIIKIRIIGPKDRLKLLDIGLLGFSLVIGVSLITISVLNLYSHLGTQIRMDNQLRELADEIRTEFRAEIQRALDQLDILKAELVQSNGPTPLGRRQKNILAQEKVKARSPYPFFEMVFWTDGSGKQQVKWSIRQQTTALVNVKRRGYFNNIKRERLWQLHDDSGLKTPRFTLEPVYSLTTGQNEVILGTPEINNNNIKISEENVELNAAYLVTRFGSIVKPVIPVGQGFAIIENDGKVLFHSDDKRNLQENFFQECDNIGLLKAFVFGRSEDYLNVMYMGRDHRLFVTPLKDLPWTLVTFRDQEIFRTINIELISVAIGMFLGYLLLISVFVLLLWIVISLLRRLRRNPKQSYFWLWPEYGKRGVYSFAIVLFAILNVLFAYRILYYDIDEVLYTTGVLPFLGTILFYVLIKEPAQSSVIRLPVKSLLGKEATKVIVPSSSFDARFVGLIICLIILVGVLPSVAFFKIAHKMETDLLIKHRQLKFAEAIEMREDRIKENYAEVQFNGQTSKDTFIKQRLVLQDQSESRTASKEPVATQQQQEPDQTQQIQEFDIYGGLFDNLNYHNPEDDKPADEASEHLHHGFERELAHLMLLYNQTTIEVRELIHDQSGDLLWHWQSDEDHNKLTLHKRRYDDKRDRCLMVSSTLPPFWQTFENGPNWWSAFQFLIGILILILAVGMFVLIRLMVRKLFLTDFSLTESPSTNVRIINSLLVNPPEPVKEQLFVDKDIHTLDLIDIAKGENWSENYPYSQLPAGKTIAINHFEHKKSDPECNSEKIRFLEELVYTHKRDLILLSNIDPNEFQYADGEEESARKKDGSQDNEHAVFSIFQKNIILDYGDQGELSEAYLAVKNELMKIPGKRKRKHCLGICDLLYDECFPTAELNKIGLEMLQKQDFIYLDKAELIDSVREKAFTYYQKIWFTCSKEERLAMVYLAKDGFANLTNRSVIQKLMRGGLIVRHPGFQLMNESFKKFVLEEGANQEVITWAKQSSTSSWGKVKIPLTMVLGGVLLFLFSTQPSAFKSTISIVSAVTAGIPTLIKILSSLKFGKSAAIEG